MVLQPSDSPYPKTRSSLLHTTHHALHDFTTPSSFFLLAHGIVHVGILQRRCGGHSARIRRCELSFRLPLHARLTVLLKTSYDLDVTSVFQPGSPPNINQFDTLDSGSTSAVSSTQHDQFFPAGSNVRFLGFRMPLVLVLRCTLFLGNFQFFAQCVLRYRFL